MAASKICQPNSRVFLWVSDKDGLKPLRDMKGGSTVRKESTQCIEKAGHPSFVSDDGISNKVDTGSLLR